MKKLYLAGEEAICRTIYGAFSKECRIQGIEIIGFIDPAGDIAFCFETGEPGNRLEELLKDDETLFLQVGNRDFDIPAERSHTLIHSSAIISDNVHFGPDNIVMPKCLFYPNFSSGRYNIFMNAFRAGHDIITGDSCFFDYYSFLGSFVNIGSGVRLGIKSMVKEYVSAGNNSFLMPGSILVENMSDGETRRGTPAKSVSE